MQWKTVIAFLIGCVLGGVAVFLFLQGTGKLALPRAGPLVSGAPQRPSVSSPPIGSPPPGPPPARTPAAVDPKPLAEPQPEVGSILGDQAIAIPVANVEKKALRDHFLEKRGGRSHDAIDILAPRGTPVLAAVDGKIARLFTSEPGGLTIYQLDRSERFIYYYAHLDRYAADMKAGKPVLRGEVIGYVGTTGNAPKNTPHLHFSIMEPPSPREWWKGKAINPYPLLISRGVTYRVSS